MKPTRCLHCLRRCGHSALLLGAAILITCCASPAAFAQSGPGSPTYSRQPRFRIPFQFDSQEMARLGAVQIELFTSTDYGRHWQSAQSVAPNEGRFIYEAAGDGEYWFAVRTIDRQGQQHPAGTLEPGLRVIVDQTPPRLDLTLRELTPGQVELTWDATDDYLNVNSLKLEFLDPGVQSWQPVGIRPTGVRVAAWNIPQGGPVRVRGSIADEAGNTAEEETSVVVRAGQPGTPQPSVLDFSQPIAGDTPPIGIDRQISVQPAQRPAVLHDQRNSTPASTTPATTSRQSRINTTSFALGYQLTNAEPGELASVDLYITEDGGARWFHYGSDQDRQSPFPVTLPGEGAYGFAIRVRDNSDMLAMPPQPGDQPESQVIIDQTPPGITLRPLQPGLSQQGRLVLIQWSTSDEALAARPVSLAFAARPEGPWQPIAENLDNNGRFDWTPNFGLPPQLFVRLSVRDAAGNVAQAVSDQPLIVQQRRPTATILGVQPIDSPPAQF